jgi:hypothetical protein
MTNATQVIGGMLKPDGTLELREPIRLPPGQVRVTVEAVSEPERQAEDWWSYLTRARAELEAAGATFSTGEEINQYIEQLRSDSEPIDAVSRGQECRERHRGDEPC